MRHCLRPLLAALLALALLPGLLRGEPAWGLEPGAPPPVVAPAVAPAAPSAAPSVAPPGASPELLSDGERLFAAHCVGCHINGGNIISRGRTLKLAALERQGLASPEAIAAIAAAGRGRMSGYGSVLGEAGPESVAAWVWHQAQAGWPRS